MKRSHFVLGKFNDISEFRRRGRKWPIPKRPVSKVSDVKSADYWLFRPKPKLTWFRLYNNADELRKKWWNLKPSRSLQQNISTRYHVKQKLSPGNFKLKNFKWKLLNENFPFLTSKLLANVRSIHCRTRLSRSQIDFIAGDNYRITKNCYQQYLSPTTVTDIIENLKVKSWGIFKWIITTIK